MTDENYFVEEYGKRLEEGIKRLTSLGDPEENYKAFKKAYDQLRQNMSYFKKEIEIKGFSTTIINCLDFLLIPLDLHMLNLESILVEDETKKPI